MPYDLKDTTFIMPVRVESEDRANNILTSVSYLLHHLDTNIIILEDDKTPEVPSILGGKLNKVKYIFNENQEYLFWKTRHLNTMARQVQTPIMVMYDCDIIMEPHLYDKSRNYITKDGYEYIVGYGDLIRVNQDQHNVLRSTMDPYKVANGGKMAAAVGSPAWVLTQKYMEAGMENEFFKSWGFEDNERHWRFVRMGLKHRYGEGQLWHLEHRRVSNNFNSNPHLDKNAALFRTVEGESPEDTKKRVATFPWLREYGLIK